MARTGWIVGTFFAMYLVATALGFLTYLLLSPLVMWICVFTLMPVVSGLLIYFYLLRMKVSRARSLRESLVVTAVWVALSFALDAITYILVVPAVSHAPRNWTFFQDQSPWIWLSYLVLLVSALGARFAYWRKIDA